MLWTPILESRSLLGKVSGDIWHILLLQSRWDSGLYGLVLIVENRGGMTSWFVALLFERKFVVQKLSSFPKLKAQNMGQAKLVAIELDQISMLWFVPVFAQVISNIRRRDA